MRLHVISWNLLADCYIRGITKLYQGESPSYLFWEDRFERIREQIQDARADIFCLQEVDHYEEDFEPFFASIGYDSIYLQRPRKPDGCLIAFNASKFSVDGKCEIQLDDLADSQNIRDQTYLKQNVCLLLQMRSLSSDIPFVVACCHIHWNPNLEDLKNNQVRYILSKIYSTVSSSTSDGANSVSVPVIFCGDFNSFPTTNMYKLITHPFDNSIEQPLRITDNYTAKEVRFLCEPSLSRLCRWMRVLGLDVAMDSWDGDTAAKEVTETGKIDKSKMKRGSIKNFFNRARSEKRVILTSSKGLRERSACPPSYFVRPDELERALINIYREFNLELNQERFLTVCGKCGGNIEEVDALDKRLMGRILPTDRPVYCCVTCAQPYWWNEDEGSSPAKAMKKASRLYEVIKEGLASKSLSSVEILRQSRIEESLVSLTEKFSIRDAVMQRSSDQSRSDENNNGLGFFNHRNEKSRKVLLEEQRRFHSTIAVDGNDDGSGIGSGSGGKVNIDADGDGSNGDCDNGSSSGSLAEKGEEGLGKAETSTSKPMLLSLTSVFGSPDNEPKLTNWNGDFKGTLDYIFVSDEWKVASAIVIPSVSVDPGGGLGGEAPACSDGLAIKEPGEDRVEQGVSLPVTLVVSSPQPSALWPSDHFMVSAIISLEKL